MSDTIAGTTFEIIADHSNHNLPIGARVTYLRYDITNDVVLYTQGGDGDEVAIEFDDLEPLINLSLKIENHYEDGDVITTHVDTSVPFPPDPDDLDEYDEWADEFINVHTGTGREDGDAAYFVEVVATSHKDTIPVGTQWEFGL